MTDPVGDAAAIANDKPPNPFSAEREYGRLMWAVLFTLLTATVGAVLTVFPYDWTRSLGVIVVTMAVGGVGGAAIGFLFGIPRVLADASLAPPALAVANRAGTADGSGNPGKIAPVDPAIALPPRRFLASNSNLEQVSDWLTKIILGVGLTQFYQLDAKLGDFKDLVARHVAATDNATPLIAAIVIVFAVLCGFLAMYLETRLVLSRIFNTVEQDLQRNLVEAQESRKIVERQLARSEGRREDAEGQANKLENVVEKIAAAPLTSPTMLASAAEWLKSVASSDQASDTLRSIAAQVLAASGRTDEADRLIDSGVGAAVQSRIAAMQVALYKDPPDGFGEAISIAGELSNAPEARRNPEYWFAGSAAFGQQHHFLLSPPHGPDHADARKSARDNALDSLRRCIEIDPSYKIRFAWLMDPSRSPTPNDRDLEDFGTDPDFLAAIEA